MGLFIVAIALFALFLPSSLADADAHSSSRLALPQHFSPPQVFKNTGLVRITNLEKGYVRETINVIVENIDKKPQSDYYLSFPSDVYSKIGGLEARDKNVPEKGRFNVEATAELPSDTQYFVIHIPEPLAPSSQITLGISYYILSSLSPRPAAISQTDRQYLTYLFSAYSTSAYHTATQKTKLKLPSTNVPDYSTTVGIKSGSSSGSDPERHGTTYTYGPYDDVAPGAVYPISVRYEFTKPLITAHLLERDIEVSHWGGNLATEERYWLRNNGSELREQFSRVEWSLTSFQGGATPALRELKYPLQPGSVDPYFTDDIGNVSTSHYRPSSSPKRDTLLELRPRYPVFGGWSYSFRVGWNNGLSSFLRRVKKNSYVLKVPFVEGPKMPEGAQYEKIVVRVILPEGSQNVRFEIVEGTTSNGLPGREQIQSELSSYRTYMDTLGRTVLTLTTENLTDEARGSQVVVTYTYTHWDALRKPFTVAAGMLSILAAAWAVGNMDVSIKRRN